MARTLAIVLAGLTLLGCSGSKPRPADPLGQRYTQAMRSGAKHIMVGNLRNAALVYRRAISEAEIQADTGRQAKAWYALAGVLARAGDNAGALEALAEARLIDDDPSLTTSSFLLESAIYAESGDADAAANSLESARAVDAQLAQAMATEFTLAQIRIAVAAGEIEQASQLLTGFAASQNPTILKLRAMASDANGDSSNAANLYEQAADIAGERADPVQKIELLRLASIARAEAGEHEQAAAHALIAGRGYDSLDFKPELAQACYRLAITEASTAGRDDIVSAAERGLVD